jgi:hypothetical protein
MTSAEHTTIRSPSVPVRGGLAVVLAVLLTAVVVRGVDALGIAPGFLEPGDGVARQAPAAGGPVPIRLECRTQSSGHQSYVNRA